MGEIKKGNKNLKTMGQKRRKNQKEKVGGKGRKTIKRERLPFILLLNVYFVFVNICLN